MTTVSQLLQQKGNDVWSVSPNTIIFDALKLMAEKNVGSLLVLENSQIAGIFSERDYARKVILQGKSSKNTPVSEIMTARVVCVYLDQTVEECMELMTENRIRHLPVLSRDEELQGMISIGDVVKAIISKQEMMINHLEEYITGKA